MSTKAHGAPIFTGLDANGSPLSGGKVHTYEAGTSTLKRTFADAAGAAANTNPVILDAAGRATVFWGSGLYKVRVEDAAGVLQWEIDNFDPQVVDLPSPSVNLVPNGSFEADTDGDGVPDGWTLTPYTGGTVDVDRYNAGTNPTPDVLHGEAALRFVSPGGAGNGGGYADQADFIEVAEGEALDVALWIKASAAGVHNQVDVRWFDSAKAALGTPQTSVYDEATANPTAWTEQRYRVTPPAGARFAKLRLYGCIDDGTTAGTTRYDHVTVRQVQPQYLRTDVADTAAGQITFLNVPIIDNGVQSQLWFRDEAGTDRWSIGCDGNPGNDDFILYDFDGGVIRFRIDAATGILYARHGTGAEARVLTTLDEAANGGTLDADTLDGAEGSQYLRKDSPDNVTATTTFTVGPSLDNDIWLFGKRAGGSTVGLAKVGFDDTVYVGDTGTPTVISHNGTLTESGGGTIWHSGNDGAGSGLDADTLDGFEADALGRLIQEVTGRNASGVTLTASVGTVVDVTVGPVAVGQRIVVNGYVKLAKGATAGSTLLTAFPLGAPVACMYGPFDTVDNLLATMTWQPAGETYTLSVSGIYRVVNAQAGFTFRLGAASLGSDGTVAADDGGILVRVING